MFSFAGTSTGSMLDEKTHVDLQFAYDLIALRDMDMFPRYSLLLPVQT